MGQSWMHGRLCELVYQVLRNAVGDEHTVGEDNFIYFHATDPARKCAPDAFVKLGVRPSPFESWKVWEHARGTPELCVEVLSPSDTKEKLTWDEKLERYAALGVAEVIAFNSDAPLGSRLSAWDRIADDLVERVVLAESTPCATLGLYWVVVKTRAPSGEELTAALRLARDARGAELVPTRAEAEKAAADAEISRLQAELEAARR